MATTTILARRWFDSFGNTYHSVACYRDQILVGKKDFVYGYGDHYLATAAEILVMPYSELRHSLRFERNSFLVSVTDVQRKKDLAF